MTKIMKRVIIIILSCLLFSGVILAQTKKDDINELFELMNPGQMIDKIFENMIDVFKHHGNTQISPEDQDEFISYLNEEVKIMIDDLINVHMVNIYDKYFSREEIKELIRFYKSPAGQKMINTMPDIQKDIMTIMMNKHIPEFQEKIQKKMEELNAREE
jgi:hypothetical protein